MLNLRYTADLRVILWEVIYFSTTLYLWYHYYSLSWGVFTLLWFTSTAFSFFGATITHNAIHVPLFKDSTLNSLFQIALTLTYGWPVSALVPGHNLSHHKFANGPKDMMRPTKMRFQSNMLNFLLFPVMTCVVIAKYDHAYMDDQRKKNRPIYKQFQIEFYIFWAVQAVLAIIDIRRYVVVVLVPQIYAKWQLIAMNTLQHDGCPLQSEDRINSARNFTGWLINFCTFENGLHTIHHSYPGMHWTSIKREHEKQIVPKIHPNLNEPNLLTYIFRVTVWPGKRLWFDGRPWEEVDIKLVPDEPWYDGTNETYSNPYSNPAG